MSGPFLLYHPESESYLWAATSDARDILLADGALLDVTGQEDHLAAAAAYDPDLAFDEGDNDLTAEITYFDGLLVSVEIGVPPVPLSLVCLEPWYFTFCSNDPHRSNCYVKFYGTYASTREQMRQHFGDHWAFQYSHEQKAECIDRWGLTEIKMS